MPLPASDNAIIADVLAGDTEAFAELVRRYQAKMLGLCYTMLSPSEAEDAAQACFIKAYRMLKTFRSKSSFGTWLFRIATNECLDRLRAQKSRRSEPLDELIPADTPLPDATLETKDMVAKLLAGLSENHRVVLSLRELSGLSYEEIAGALNLSLNAVKARLKRAREETLKIYRHFSQKENV